MVNEKKENEKQTDFVSPESPQHVETLVDSAPTETTTFKFGSFSSNNFSTTSMKEATLEPNINEIQNLEEVKKQELDPLNNANNPIPVNPSSPKVEKKDYSDVALSGKELLKSLPAYLKKPLSTTDEFVEKYQYYGNAIKLSFILCLLSIVSNFVFTSLLSIISRGYNISSESYHITINMANLLNHDWLTLFLVSLSFSLLLNFILSLTYYFYSFIKNKGLTYGKLLMISNMSFIYLNVGVSFLYPIGNILNPFFGVVFVFITFVLSIIIFYNKISEELKFATKDKTLLNNIFLLGIAFFILSCLIYLYYVKIFLT